MTGMKEGAGEDPFAEDPDDEEAAELDEPNAGAGESDESAAAVAREAGPGDRSEKESTGQAADDEQDLGSPGGQQTMQIPYKYRRDGVQDGRDRVPLFLQSETKTAEREALRSLEDHFDEDVSLTDLREAMVKTGLDNLDEVANHLEAWGYGMTFED